MKGIDPGRRRAADRSAVLRPSEMRLDRLLLVDPAAVRREGATLSRTVFEQATRALRRHWG